jgi:hypothetical protein
MACLRPSGPFIRNDALQYDVDQADLRKADRANNKSDFVMSFRSDTNETSHAHLKSVRAKLGVKDTGIALLEAHKRGLIEY